MPFVKGQARHPMAGKTKGSKHKITTLKVREVILASGKNPAQEVLALMPMLDPKDQAKLWIELLSWIETKPVTSEKNEVNDNYSELLEKYKDCSKEDMVLIVRNEANAIRRIKPL